MSDDLRASRRQAARDYFSSRLRHTPLCYDHGLPNEETSMDVFRHAGHNGAAAISVRPGKAEVCFIFDCPEELEEFIDVLEGLLEAQRTEIECDQ